MKTIELDCAPGFPRPGDLIGDVVKGTALEGKVGEPVSKIFGCWMWSFPEVTDHDWATARLMIAPRITKLYRRGAIRYGSW